MFMSPQRGVAGEELVADGASMLIDVGLASTKKGQYSFGKK